MMVQYCLALCERRGIVTGSCFKAAKAVPAAVLPQQPFHILLQKDELQKK